ncbi:MAG: DUF72 domain-containing protein [Deltaproteobacteria bacterium]|nr:DUF72 domain-containing protein [Deltaproteobacteria bacterium]
MRIDAGTSGYSYKEWCGPFYPEKTAAADMLAFYGERLPSVEINNTFYRLPKASVLEAWAGQVPDGFRFAIKASRRITHIKRLKEVADETAYPLRTVDSLGAKLGALLFQLPPNLRCDLEKLDAFLAVLPEGTRAAFEFRHDSWRDAAVHDRLRARNFALVVVDDEDAPTPEIEPTARWGYLRLRRPGYDAEALRGWSERIQAQPWDEAFVYFKHEDAGAGPRMAGELLALTGASAKRAPAEEPRAESEAPAKASKRATTSRSSS